MLEQVGALEDRVDAPLLGQQLGQRDEIVGRLGELLRRAIELVEAHARAHVVGLELDESPRRRRRARQIVERLARAASRLRASRSARAGDGGGSAASSASTSAAYSVCLLPRA